jgi:hypothetical protein
MLLYLVGISGNDLNRKINLSPVFELNHGLDEGDNDLASR